MTKAIVVGAGLNGLTAAAYLAKAGWDVTVLEKRGSVGGLLDMVEIAPGYRASVGPDLAGLLSTSVVDELQLSHHGLELLPLDPVAFAPESDGPGLALWRDTDKAAAEIRRLSSKDAEAYPRFRRLVDDITGFLEPLLTNPPPTPDVRSAADIIEMLKLGLGFKKLGTATMHELMRVLPMSISDFLDEWFENDLLKGLLAGPALEGVCLGPRSQGTAALFLYQRMERRARLPKGGTGAIIKALAAVVKTAGGTIRTGCAVSRIRSADGTVQGVETEDGETLDASVIVSGLSPQRTLLELADPAELPPTFVGELDNIRYRGVTAKLNLALSELPTFSSGSGKLGGVVHIGPDLDYLERAYDAVKYGTDSEHPFLQVVIPSLADPSLAPDGKHVMSVLVQFAPSNAAADEHRAARVLDTLETYAPGLRGAIVAQQMWAPADYERELGLTEGCWHHGEMALDQMFFMRPVPGWAQYGTPIEGLILGGPGCHPGGGTTAIPGANAAKAALAQR